MDHIHAHDHGTAGLEGVPPMATEYPMSSLLDGLPETQHNQLLEMLHVPLLHGGVKESFLLPAFTTYSDASFAVACIVLALISCLLELLRFALSCLEGRYLSEGGEGSSNSCSCKQCMYPVLSLGSDRKNYNTMHNLQQVDGPTTEPVPAPSTKHTSRLYRWTVLAGVGLLQMITYQGATMLMLVAMTMNIFLIISLGVGATIGRVVSLYLKRRQQEKRK